MRTALLSSVLFASLCSAQPPAICDELQTGFSWQATPGGVQFSNATTGTGQENSWFWDFGDGQSSALAQPLHEYAAPGSYEVCLYAISIYFNGSAPTTCVDTACATVVVGGGDPCTGLEACFVTNNLGDGAIFFDNCSGPMGDLQFLWHFGDGVTSTATNADHLYALPGIYEVCLTAFYQNCVDTACSVVVIEGGDPCAGFQATLSSQPVIGTPGSIHFAGTVPTGADWLWTFGDGALNSDALEGTHHYAQEGTYELCLSAWAFVAGSQTVCADTVCALITIVGGDPCQGLDAGFEWTSGANGVIFSNTTVGTGFQTIWQWSFGDGGNSGDPQPLHMYSAPGVYEVCLLVVSSYETPNGVLSCTSQYCHEVLIGSDPCADLEACFIVNDLGNGNFFFDNCSGPMENLQYQWQFGDGETSSVTNAEHHFLDPGVYEVCLFTYYLNCVDTACATIVVEGGGPCSELSACFTATSIDSYSFLFTNCTQPGSGVQYVWHFGDGTSANGVAADHTYAEAGIYNACLVAYWNDCVDEVCQPITVTGAAGPCDQLEAGFQWTSGANGVIFSNTTVGTGFQTTWSWTFGDGSTSNDAQPFHTYNEPGTYEVCLLAISIYESPNGPFTCTSEACGTVVVQGQVTCDPGFAVDMAWNTGQDNVVFFNATSNHAETYFIWYFGDGTEGYGPQTTHTYSAPGNYQVCVAGWYYNAAAGDSCWAEDCAMIVIGQGQGCAPDYVVDFTWFAQGNAVVFTAISNHPSAAYYWQFGDGTADWAGATVTHLYEPPGPYEVCVLAWYWEGTSQDTCWAEHCALVSPFTTGLSEATADPVRVHPVPAHDWITVSGIPARSVLSLFSPDGRLVRNMPTTSTTVYMQLSGLASGAYVLRIEGPGTAIRRKVILE